jgi:hypothetical protein
VSSYPGRWLVVLGLVLWVVSVLYLAACLAGPSLLGGTACELAPGSSVFREASRSWLPPGTTCTWELGGYGRHVEGPSPLRLVVVVWALAGWPLTRYLHGLLGRPALVGA